MTVYPLDIGRLPSKIEKTVLIRIKITYKKEEKRGALVMENSGRASTTLRKRTS